mmetsp:Transcript_4779/g.5517  ORF Transcript_4779/g.5517 Transcript_4779/m.5517 type:complete len:89 (+) Transcript_4779:766-1032(+)
MCPHRRGGADVEGFNNGNDNDNTWTKNKIRSNINERYKDEKKGKETSFKQCANTEKKIKNEYHSCGGNSNTSEHSHTEKDYDHAHSNS